MLRWSTSSSMILASMILVLELMLAALAGAELSSRIVRTKYGELSGVIVTLDRYLEGVEVFRGVPYASPPIGSLRFMPPVSGALWHGVKVADKFGPVCPQKLPELTDKMPKGRLEYLRRLLPYLRNQSEDCLYLNIYTPVQGEFFQLFSLHPLFINDLFHLAINFLCKC
ncbi:PREDICTED: neuroligin-4, Y-linked-like [Polistes canadensis]|uniref:neuroligin-4, Y-linked-like n=1 Tax=Polistes canadensis TaxID=91411 RepID=UPI000718B575|nr:PREDICTED: neuroligin-4, Y-linked-like [Polistes canadensis]